MEQVVLSSPETAASLFAGGQLVSVVIINYNYGRYLRECIESVLEQDYEPKEVIVVDDGSTDDSRSVIDSYSGRLFASFKQNGGMVTAMNHGYELSHGSIVIFVDADDYLFPGAISAHAAALSEPGVVRSQTYMTVLQGSNPSNKTIPDSHAPAGNLRELTLEKGPGAYVSSPNSGNAWSRKFLKRVFPLPEKPRTIGSETFLMDAAPFFGEIVTLGEVKAAYRLHGANMNAAGIGMTLGNIRMALGHSETRMDRLAETATSLGYNACTADWKASNWRLLTLSYLSTVLSGKGQAPGFIEHMKSTFEVRNPLKRGVVASVVLGIRTMPTKVSLWLASRVIQLRYM